MPDDAKRLQEQRLVLGRAARMLASAADFEDTLKQTLAACLPALGDYGFFDVVVAGDEVRRTVAAHEAPHIEEQLAPTRWQKQEHPELNLCALTSGEVALHPEIGDEWYRRAARSEQQLASFRSLGFRSMISVPVRYRDELVGALTLFMGASGRRHGQEHAELASELALLAAPLVVNARLLAQHERTEAALRQSSERLRIAVEAGRMGIWDWHIPSGRIAWSERSYEIHGLPKGSDPGGLEGLRARTHPDDAPRLQAAIAAALDGSAPYEVEFRTVRPDGSIRWLSARSHVVRDASGEPLRMIGATIDITERVELLAAERRARAEAETARARLEQVAHVGAMLARSLDPDATLQAIASAIVPAIADWCRIDLLDEHGELQQRLAHHTDPARAARALALAQHLLGSADTPGTMRWSIRTGQGHYGRFDEPPALNDAALREYAQAFGKRAYYTVPLVARGRTIGAMRVVQAESGRDISEPDRRLIRELGHRAALALDNARAYSEAEAARREAERANRAKDEFLAMLGHELRNPLAPIITALELMARRETGAHVEERRIIGRQVAHLSRLIDDLLDVSRITQGKVRLQRSRIELGAVVAQALEQTQPLFERRARPVLLALPESPVWVQGDATRLTQVLCNLLVNAAKFTPDDRDVRLALRHDGDRAEIAVEDDGRGMPPDLLPNVFELFVQGRQSLDRRGGGLGLGLAIVRMLVDMHGGEVLAYSEGEDRGSRFVVRLPVLDPEAGMQSSPSTSDPAVQPPAGSARLLIVDDNVDAADTLADLLRVLGYEVRTANEGGAAMRMLDGYRPQLALLDIGLPGEDGYALATRMRADPRMGSAKLVALTGYGSDSDRARALASCFDEHLVKPVAVDRLMAVLQKLVG